MRKTIQLLLVCLMAIGLAGCSASDKQTLMNYYDKMAEQKSTKTSISVNNKTLNVSKFNKLKKSDQKIFENIKHTSLSGQIYSDGTNGKGSFKLYGVDEKNPLIFIGNKKKFYLNAGYYKIYLQVLQILGSKVKKPDNSPLDILYVD
ncbi:hypothetical protein [Xylocopilactobacillus apis]|uniref:Lipoprotein n=1 Tax=Xylocopilactobacillus apis TaxID=2932183 RepID=A0AAU9CX32_9LACO|nr:hypothetical protein [Xylocopilactobacillus apis]BDR56991.1 hypothetical protein KIMC2_15530 [Xylocopilactobacillus apis]